MKLYLNQFDILNKKFKKGVKGYDSDEVDDFLDKVLRDYRNFDTVCEEYDKSIVSLKRESETLKAEVRELNNELSIQKSKNIAAKNLSHDDSNIYLDPIDLLEKCSKYEKKLYELGVDPSKIK
jgi:DivIVA domain-containing protein